MDEKSIRRELITYDSRIGFLHVPDDPWAERARLLLDALDERDKKLKLAKDTIRELAPRCEAENVIGGEPCGEIATVVFWDGEDRTILCEQHQGLIKPGGFARGPYPWPPGLNIEALLDNTQRALKIACTAGKQSEAALDSAIEERDEARRQANQLARAMIWERNRCPAFHPSIPHRKCQMEEPCHLGTLDNDGDIVDDKQGQQWFAQLTKCWRLWASKQPTGQVPEEQGSDGDAEAPA